MGNKRTGGMTAVGVLNIVFGAIGALFALLIVLGGGMIAAMGAGMEAEFGAEFEGAAVGTAGLGGVMAIVGIVAFAASAAMLFSGIGVLGLKPWGRKLAMVCGGAWAVLNIITLFSGFNLFNLGFAVYGGLLVWLFLQPDWKAAFSGQPAAIEDTQSIDEFQQAA